MINTGALLAELARPSPEKQSTRRFAFISLEAPSPNSTAGGRSPRLSPLKRTPRKAARSMHFGVSPKASPRSPAVWAIDAVERILIDTPDSKSKISKPLFENDGGDDEEDMGSSVQAQEPLVDDGAPLLQPQRQAMLSAAATKFIPKGHFTASSAETANVSRPTKSDTATVLFHELEINSEVNSSKGFHELNVLHSASPTESSSDLQETTPGAEVIADASGLSNTRLAVAAAKCDHTNACKIFDSAVNSGVTPDLGMFNSVIQAHGRDLVGASQWLDRMQSAGLSPNTETYAILIQAAAKLGELDKAEEWFENMTAACLQPTEEVFNALASGFARENKVQDAERWLTALQEALNVTPVRQTFTAIIAAYIAAGDMQSAESVFDRMHSAGVDPDAAVYNSILAACASRGDIASAELWFQRLKSSGLEATDRSYNCMLNACAKQGSVTSAVEWFQMMQDDGVQPDTVTYNSMIALFASKGDVENAQKWFSLMLQAGIAPNDRSWNTMISACMARKDREACVKWFNDMVASGGLPDEVTYNSMLNAAVQEGDVVGAEQWFARMQHEGVVPNVITYGTLISGYASQGDAPRATAWFMQMQASGIPPNSTTFSSLINAYAKNSDPAGAEYWFGMMISSGVVPNEVTFNTMISAFAKQGNVPRASHWFHAMQVAGRAQNEVSYNALINACAKARPPNFNVAAEVLQMMLDSGLRPNAYTLPALLRCCSASVEVHRISAKAWFQQFIPHVSLNNHVIRALRHALGSGPEFREELDRAQAGKNITSSLENGNRYNNNHKNRSRNVGKWK